MNKNVIVKFYTQCSKSVCTACGGSGCITEELDDDGEMCCQVECSVCGGTGYTD